MLFQSFAKNFGLYGERAGCCSIVTTSQKESFDVTSNLKILNRNLHAFPPLHGARIVDIILNDKKLESMWKEDLVTMSSRIKVMREGLVSRL